ncbi:hypothetical protein [Sphingobium yanoikuyae]|uniref:Uncharacterized protein n=1 Tax=Sphingobium yanoikuyae TaxID=13690 RepID=A0A430BWW9_SPHYA|nr:hypothetical protein [Sphingobium yanoikuyae]RSU57222.1 hypothetical protein DAH51_10440 [Sphingobium yanoikuyae]
MARPNINNASAITPAMADRIVGWLDAQRQGPAPVGPTEQVEVWTLADMTVVFIGDRDAAIFREESHG